MYADDYKVNKLIPTTARSIILAFSTSVIFFQLVSSFQFQETQLFPHFFFLFSP